MRLRLEARNRLVTLCRRLNVVLREKPVAAVPVEPGAFDDYVLEVIRILYGFWEVLCLLED